MTPLRTWSTVQVAGLLLTASPHLQDLTNEMPSGDSVVCKQLNTAFSCALGQGKTRSYTTCPITGAHRLLGTFSHRRLVSDDIGTQQDMVIGRVSMDIEETFDENRFDESGVIGR